MGGNITGGEAPLGSSAPPAPLCPHRSITWGARRHGDYSDCCPSLYVLKRRIDELFYFRRVEAQLLFSAFTTPTVTSSRVGAATAGKGRRVEVFGSRDDQARVEVSGFSSFHRSSTIQSARTHLRLALRCTQPLILSHHSQSSLTPRTASPLRLQPTVGNTGFSKAYLRPRLKPQLIPHEMELPATKLSLCQPSHHLVIIGRFSFASKVIRWSWESTKLARLSSNPPSTPSPLLMTRQQTSTHTFITPWNQTFSVASVGLSHPSLRV